MADKFKDNHTMTRVLKDRYDSQKEPGKTLPSIRFGQSPESRSEVFNKFAKTIYNAAKSGACPSLAGGGKLKTVRDYYNHIAKSSLEDMRPFEGEDFSNLDADFPVETVSGKVKNVAGGSASSNPAEFNFNFTPVR